MHWKNQYLPSSAGSSGCHTTPVVKESKRVERVERVGLEGGGERQRAVNTFDYDFEMHIHNKLLCRIVLLVMMREYFLLLSAVLLLLT